MVEFREDPAGRRRAVLESASGITRRAANAIAGRAKQIVPVDTGDLRGSIGVRAGLFGAHEVYVGGTAAPYWLHVEYGTRYQHAQPFMRPAVFSVRTS